MAAVILESAGVSVPTGRVADGVYDERGACYVVPRYCLSKPRNLVRSRGLSGTPSVGTSVGGYWQGKKSGESADGVSLASSAGNASLVGVPVAGQVTEVTVRLAVGKDVSVKMGLDTTVAAVERELKEEHHVPPNARVRFFHLGRSLDPASMPLRDLKLGSAGVIQAMYS
ncbi:hypothetical protein FBU59_000012 [Linderina macrospora]|uniref:Uncharacterized protein n=1 Tax=Linderina macrospora TaxID=4868 RepID=A0ACC1JI89_9FUNG|nr:hypothetical protein FBU59_000012 [Linderina macrospora]